MMRQTVESPPTHRRFRGTVGPLDRAMTDQGTVYLCPHINFVNFVSLIKVRIAFLFIPCVFLTLFMS